MPAASDNPRRAASDSDLSPDRAERLALAAELLRVGPDAPTIPEGWRARDLAAHLVVRERRPDAAAGLVVGPLKGHLDRVQAGYAARPWDELVGTFRDGPPRWSPTAVPAVGQLANTLEHFVHHEDVRRAQPGWQPRALPPRLEEALWQSLRSRGRVLYRKAPVGVVLRRLGEDPDGDIVARDAEPRVVVAGPAQEVLLHAFGRTTVARVTVEGPEDAVRALAGTPLGL